MTDSRNKQTSNSDSPLDRFTRRQFCTLAAGSVAGLAAGNLLSRGARAAATREAETFRPFNFAILADLHLPERQGMALQRFELALEQIAARGDIAFVIILGDIIWDRNVEGLKPILARPDLPVHLLYGNNDWKWIDNGSYEANLGPRDHSFTHNNCTFIQMWNCMPKTSPDHHRGHIADEQWEWLEAQLQAAEKSRHTFLSMHIPPAAPKGYNASFFMFEETEQRFYEMLEKYPVTAAFFGHLHQNDTWTRGRTRLIVQPATSWNFINRRQKVDSSFMRIIRVEQNRCNDELLPVHLDGETFTYDTLAQFYDPDKAPR